jgi:hypothetical protein
MTAKALWDVVRRAAAGAGIESWHLTISGEPVPACVFWRAANSIRSSFPRMSRFRRRNAISAAQRLRRAVNDMMGLEPIPHVTEPGRTGDDRPSLRDHSLPICVSPVALKSARLSIERVGSLTARGLKRFASNAVTDMKSAVTNVQPARAAAVHARQRQLPEFVLDQLAGLDGLRARARSAA